jgi:hypothetical protein
MEVLCFKMDPVVGKGGGLASEDGEVEAVVEKGLYDWIGFCDGECGMGPEVVLCIEVIEDELVVVVEGELEVIAGGAFDGDGGAGEADGEVVSLPGPGKVFDEVPGFGECPLFAFGEFAWFVVF